MNSDRHPPSRKQLQDAEAIVRRHMEATPQFCWPLLSRRLGAEVWVKHENCTPLGAFKVRGGLVYFEELVRTHPEVKGVVAATRGNHGQSVAFAARKFGLRATIVVPFGNSVEKNAAMRAQGAEMIEHGDDFQAALEEAQRLAKARGLWMVPSYHEALVAGVATYAMEFFAAVVAAGGGPLDVIYVPIGMGSGACGVIVAKEALGLKTEVVGVVAQAAPAYAESIPAGKVISRPVASTVADGMACRTPDLEAVMILKDGLARVVTVTNAEVEEAMRVLFSDTHHAAEGAGAAAMAALLQERERVRGKRAGVVLSGGNVDREVFAKVLSSAQGK